MNREQLLATAVTVGLVLGVDFEKNISNANLQKKIDEKQEELSTALKGSDSTDATLSTDDFDSDEERLSVTLKALEDGNLKEEDLSDYDKELLSKHRQEIDEALGVPKDLLGKETEGNTATDLQKKIDELDDEQLDDDVTVQRVSSCGGYKTKIKGLKEAARRSGVSVEQIQEALETGNPVGGYTFTFIG